MRVQCKICHAFWFCACVWLRKPCDCCLLITSSMVSTKEFNNDNYYYNNNNLSPWPILFAENLLVYSSYIMTVQRTQIIQTTFMFINHLATSTSTGASQKCAVIIAPPSSESDKLCCHKRSGNCRAKIPKDQRIRTTTVNNEEKRRSEGSNLLTYGRRLDPNKSTEEKHRPNPARSA